MHKKPVTFLNLPEYPGGKEQFKKFIKEHLKYPEKALRNKVEGTVFLSAEISGKGEVSNIKVEKGIGSGCDEEALRILGLARFGGVKNRGVRVKTSKRFRINFRLPKDTITERKINYSYSSSEPSTDENQKKKTSYSYTIKINPK